MKEQAEAIGANAVINVRFSTSASLFGRGQTAQCQVPTIFGLGVKVPL